MALTEAISKPGRTETRPIPHIQEPWHALCSLFWKQNAREEGEEASRGNLEIVVLLLFFCFQETIHLIFS